MTSMSPKRKRGPDLPLDTQRITLHPLLDGDCDEVESPRTKVSKKFDTLEIHGQVNQQLHQHTEQREHPGPWSCAAESTASPVEIRDPTDLMSVKLSSAPPPGSDTAQLTSTSVRDESIPAESKLSRSNSPPPDGEISEIFWHDSEITGHDPTDPTDDGYGINGIGFKPTPALAWSRSQRRRQQLSDLRNREGREARQQRSERRKRFLSESDDGASAAESSPRKSARVHFEDG